MKKTLVVRACAIGDFVLNLQALRALQNVYPNTVFTLVGYPATLELAKEFITIDAIHSIEVTPWRRLFYEPIEALNFDDAIVWMKAESVADNIRASGIPNVLQLEPFPNFGHAANHLLRTLGLRQPRLPDLWRIASNAVILHPTSGSPHKCWPYFSALMRRQPDSKILIGPVTPPDGAWLSDLEPTRVLRNLTLSEVAETLKSARAYIGNDSGITHLAAYLGVPTLSLFGPTDPRIWGPIGRRSRIIWKPRLEDISVNEVLQASRFVLQYSSATIERRVFNDAARTELGYES